MHPHRVRADSRHTDTSGVGRCWKEEFQRHQLPQLPQISSCISPKPPSLLLLGWLCSMESNQMGVGTKYLGLRRYRFLSSSYHICTAPGSFQFDLHHWRNGQSLDPTACTLGTIGGFSMAASWCPRALAGVLLCGTA